MEIIFQDALRGEGTILIHKMSLKAKPEQIGKHLLYYAKANLRHATNTPNLHSMHLIHHRTGFFTQKP